MFWWWRSEGPAIVQVSPDCLLSACLSERRGTSCAGSTLSVSGNEPCPSEGPVCPSADVRGVPGSRRSDGEAAQGHCTGSVTAPLLLWSVGGVSSAARALPPEDLHAPSLRHHRHCLGWGGAPRPPTPRPPPHTQGQHATRGTARLCGRLEGRPVERHGRTGTECSWTSPSQRLWPGRGGSWRGAPFSAA